MERWWERWEMKQNSKEMVEIWGIKIMGMEKDGENVEDEMKSSEERWRSGGGITVTLMNDHVLKIKIGWNEVFFLNLTRV